jgi:hypothetical protein
MPTNPPRVPAVSAIEKSFCETWAEVSTPDSADDFQVIIFTPTRGSQAQVKRDAHAALHAVRTAIKTLRVKVK